MKMKAILFIRVSTKQQEFDMQRSHLEQMAANRGYAPEDIITIEVKESGIKLAEADRQGILKLKNYIENDSEVNCVFVREVSRLGRNETVEIIKNYLVDRKVNLIVKEPQIELLDDNGNINNAAEITFALLSVMAKQEMRIKKERFAEGRERRIRDGKIPLGRVQFGYRVNKDGYIEPDPVTGEIVKLMYNLYANENYSYNQLVRELYSRGYKIQESNIKRLLSDTKYIGIFKNVKHTAQSAHCKYLTINYPRLISDKLFYKVREVAKQRLCTADKALNEYVKRYHLGSKLIKCKDCGHFFSFIKSGNRYGCKRHTDLIGTLSGNKCPNGETINATALEELLWIEAKGAEFYANKKQSEENKKKNEAELAVVRQKIAKVEKDLSEYTDKKDKVAELYVDGEINQDKKNKMYKDLETLYKANLEELDIYKNQESYITEILTDTKSSIDDMLTTEGLVQDIGSFEDKIAAISEPKHKYELVHKHIAEVKFTTENFIYKNKLYKGAKHIQIIHKNGFVAEYVYLCRPKLAIYNCGTPDETCINLKNAN